MCRPVILDTDIGGDIDDTWALGVLLRLPELNLRAITTVTGDTLYRARLCAQLLRVAGHPLVPMGIGKREADVYQWQKNWLDSAPAIDDESFIQPDAAQLIIDTVKASPVPMTLICIGPLENIAEVVKRAPELTAKIDLLVMGGSVCRQYFGKPGRCPEYNIQVDIPSARAVFQASWRSFWLTPLDTCGNIFIQGKRYRRFVQSNLPLPRAIVENYRVWCAARQEKVNADETSTLIADVAAVVQAAFPDMTYNSYLPLSVNENGETVIDPENGSLVKVAVEWKDVDEFYDLTISRLLYPGL